MNKDRLMQHFDRYYAPKRGILPRLPLGMDPDEVWQEIQNRRKAKSTALPIHNVRGIPYWFVTTDRMVSASETLVEELMACDDSPFQGQPVLAPLEEVFYTCYVEGSSMTMQAAMEFLQGGEEPRDVEEQMIANNRAALNFAVSNLYHPVDEEFIKMLALILTLNMEGGGGEYRASDWVEIPSMVGEGYELPSAISLPDRARELTGFLVDTGVHPLIKAAVAQAWVLTVRPFPEGNERLARLLSTVILIRYGYTFLGEVSLSALIARNGYSYFDAVANILRAEHGGDLTYFMEYYIVLLSQAVYERRRKKAEAEEESLTAGIEMAKSVLIPDTKEDDSGDDSQDDSASGHMASDHLSDSEHNFDSSGDSVLDCLTADGYVSLMNEEDTLALERAENRWSGEDNAREQLKAIVFEPDTQHTRIANLLLTFLDAEKYYFSSMEVNKAMRIPKSQTHSLLHFLRDKGDIEQLTQMEINYGYTFCCGALSESDYTPGMIRDLKDLAFGTRSMKDRRIGTMLLNNLTQGYITLQPYRECGEENKWIEDMKLAEQMGLVKMITNERCLILRDAKPCFEMLDPKQKKRVRQMYETFGEETFSLEMVVATLEYGSSTASAYLHQFTLLRILDCRKEEVNLYQLLVNPREHPELFGDVALKMEYICIDTHISFTPHVF